MNVCIGNENSTARAAQDEMKKSSVNHHSSHSTPSTTTRMSAEKSDLLIRTAANNAELSAIASLSLSDNIGNNSFFFFTCRTVNNGSLYGKSQTPRCFTLRVAMETYICRRSAHVDPFGVVWALKHHSDARRRNLMHDARNRKSTLLVWLGLNTNTFQVTKM